MQIFPIVYPFPAPFMLLAKNFRKGALSEVAAGTLGVHSPLSLAGFEHKPGVPLESPTVSAEELSTGSISLLSHSVSGRRKVCCNYSSLTDSFWAKIAEFLANQPQNSPDWSHKVTDNSAHQRCLLLNGKMWIIFLLNGTQQKLFTACKNTFIRASGCKILV